MRVSREAHAELARKVTLNGSRIVSPTSSPGVSIGPGVTVAWRIARAAGLPLYVAGSGAAEVSEGLIVCHDGTRLEGDIHYVGTPAAGGIFEFSNHSGAVDMQIARDATGTFVLSSIIGAIENGFSGVRPVASTPHSMRLTLGRGGANVTVRTYKGPIRLRPN